MGNAIQDNSILVTSLHNSMLVNALISAITFVNMTAHQIDEIIGNSYRTSRLNEYIRGCCRAVNSIFCGSILLNTSKTMILMIMLFIKERLAHTCIGLYNGSEFMDITGKAILDSRIMKWLLNE